MKLFIILNLFFTLHASAQNGAGHGGGDEIMKEVQNLKRDALEELKKWHSLLWLPDLKDEDITQIEKVSALVTLSFHDHVYLPEDTSYAKKGQEETMVNTRCTDQFGRFSLDLNHCFTQPAFDVGLVRWNAPENTLENKKELLFHEIISVALDQDTDFRILYRALRAKNEASMKVKNEFISMIDELSLKIYASSRLDLNELESYTLSLKNGSEYKKCISGHPGYQHLCNKIADDFLASSGPLKTLDLENKTARETALQETKLKVDLELKNIDEATRNRFIIVYKTMESDVSGTLLTHFNPLALIESECDSTKKKSALIQCIFETAIPKLKEQSLSINQKLAQELPPVFEKAKSKLKQLFSSPLGHDE